MKLSTFLVIAAVVYAFFGIALLFVPAEFMAYYGVAMNAGGVLIARVLGASLLAFTLVYWWSQKEPNRGVLRSVIRASALYNAIGIGIALYAVQKGIANKNAWQMVVIHASLFAGFGHFGFMKKR